MTTPCPLCRHVALDAYRLSLHLAADHPHRQDRVVIVAPIPIFECDIDRIHRVHGALTKPAEAIHEHR